MDMEPLSKKAETHLQKLCVDISNRRVGSAGNRKATDYFAEIVSSFGFETESPPFDCIDWSQDGANLVVNGETYEVLVSPYSLGCNVRGPLLAVTSIAELAAIDSSNAVLLMHGDIAKEQIMPKNFPFYNPDRHKQIVYLLEAKHPLAIVAATSRNPELAGGIYPFPLFEDGDFDIPSVYMTEDEGKKLGKHVGSVVSLDSKSTRIPSTGCNVIARKMGVSDQKVVVVAHIDAKIDSPGAIDNGTGVIVLLLLAELLEDYSGTLGIEIVAFNGEDYYAAPGQIQYFAMNSGELSNMVLGINIDAAGFVEGKTAYSLYGPPPEVADAIHRAFASQEGMVEGEPWYQSDHSIFIQNQIPALAITSARFDYLTAEITHTPKDNPEIVDPVKLGYIALALKNIVMAL
jgi:aminopeptidase YwaD